MKEPLPPLQIDNQMPHAGVVATAGLHPGTASAAARAGEAPQLRPLKRRRRSRPRRIRSGSIRRRRSGGPRMRRQSFRNPWQQTRPPPGIASCCHPSPWYVFTAYDLWLITCLLSPSSDLLPSTSLSSSKKHSALLVGPLQVQSEAPRSTELQP